VRVFKGICVLFITGENLYPIDANIWDLGLKCTSSCTRDTAKIPIEDPLGKIITDTSQMTYSIVMLRYQPLKKLSRNSVQRY